MQAGSDASLPHPNPNLRPVAYPALDGLRCYAALLVFLVHLLGGLLTEYYRVPEAQLSALSPVPGIAILTFLADGHHGVDIFFVISGFLMARIARPGMGWTRFVVRRVRRIYPAFLASLALTAAVYCSLYDWSFQWKDFLLNLVFFNSWPGHGIVAYNHVTWSLGYEFAFYLAVPLLAWCRPLPVRAVVAGIAMLLAMFLLPGPLVRMSGLFAGFLLGCMSDRALCRVAAAVPVWLAVVAYCGLVLAKSFWPLDFVTFHRLLLPLIMVVLTCIVFGNNLLNRVFASAALRKLGTWSYSIYLLHPVVISLTIYTLLPKTGLHEFPAFAVPFICMVSAAGTVALAMVSYRLLEAPYFRSKQSASPLLIATPSP